MPTINHRALSTEAFGDLFSGLFGENVFVIQQFDDFIKLRAENGLIINGLGEIDTVQYGLTEFRFLEFERGGQTVFTIEDTAFTIFDDVTELWRNEVWLYNGSLANETISTGLLDDRIVARGGDDVIAPSDGVDFVNGGAGSDTISYADGVASVGVDVRIPAGWATDQYGQRDTFVSIENAETTDLADNALGNAAANVFTMHRGDDVADGRGGADVIEGGLGDDTLYGRGGEDLIYGGSSDGSAEAGVEATVLDGPSVDQDRILAGQGDDQAWGGFGDDAIFGHMGDDALFGESGADRLSGGGGDDALTGGTGADRLVGGRGDDTLIGGAAGAADDDHLRGGAGADAFVFFEGDGVNRILDFEDGVDTVLLSVEAPVFLFSDLTITDETLGATAVFGSTTIVFRDVASAALDASDFVIDFI